MVTYQFEVDADTWAAWKDTVPRSKNLDERLRELVVADSNNRVESGRAARTLYVDPSDEHTVEAVVPAVVAEHTDDDLAIVSVTDIRRNGRAREDGVERLPSFVFREAGEVVERFQGRDEVVRHAGDREVYDRLGAAEGHIDIPTPTPDVDREALAEALAGSGDVLERRVDAVVEMYAHLREEGAAKKSDLLDAIDVDATGYDSEASVWANMVKGRDTLRALPGVEPPGSGMSTWRYTGE